MACKNKKCAAELVDNATFCHKCGRKQDGTPRKHRKRANGAGTVYKLSGRRRCPWAVVKNKTYVGFYETQAAALKVANSLVDIPISERYNMTFSEAYKDWSFEHFRDLTPSGISDYKIAYKHFKSLHDRTFRSLRTTDFQHCVDEYVKKGRSRSSASKLKQLIGQMSKWAIREEIIPTNYAPFIRLPEEVKKEKELFSDKDIETLKNSHDDAAKITLMLIFTGMRIGELFSMPVSDVHDTYCIGGSKTEAGKNRIIPIVSEARQYFNYFKDCAKDGGLLLSGYGGNHDIHNFRKRDYYPLLESLGIGRKTPHSTRHTFTSRAVKAGLRAEDLQKILGHAKYDTTASVYYHTDIETLVKAAEKIVKKKAKKTISES